MASLQDAARIDRMVRIAYSRPAEPDEIALGLQLREGKRPPSPYPSPRAGERGRGDGAANRLSPWEQYAQVLLEANKFAFVD